MTVKMVGIDKTWKGIHFYSSFTSQQNGSKMSRNYPTGTESLLSEYFQQKLHKVVHFVTIYPIVF